MIGEFFLMKITLKLILNIAYHLGDKKQNYSKLPKTTLYSIFFILMKIPIKKNCIKEHCEKSFENKLCVTLYTSTKGLSLVL